MSVNECSHASWPGLLLAAIVLVPVCHGLFWRQALPCLATESWAKVEPCERRRSMVAKVPVLVVAYRRYDFLSRVIVEIPNDRPVYIVVDGPRDKSHESDVRITRGLVEAFAFSRRDVNILIRDVNLGGPLGIPAAIDWVFQREDQALIFEEDCVPSPLCFPFVDNILPSFANCPSAAGVTLNNCVAARGIKNYSAPFLSIFTHNWGWLTSRKCWERLRPDPRAIGPMSSCKISSELRSVLATTFPGDVVAQHYWKAIFESLLSGESYHWDYNYSMNLWLAGLKFIAPPCNLVTNIGIDGRSQNCKSKSPNHLLPITSDASDGSASGLFHALDENYSYKVFDKLNQSIVFTPPASAMVRSRQFLSRLLRRLASTSSKEWNC